jgi:hypothetical protein
VAATDQARRMNDQSIADAVRAASATIDVPGAPNSLRLEGIEVGPDQVVVQWSFRDPETPSGAPDRRLPGTTILNLRDGTGSSDPQHWWAKVQLDAGHAYKGRIDADWVPGQPVVPRVWGAEEAWGTLCAHLRVDADSVEVLTDEIRATRLGEVTTYRFTPQAWADHLNAIAADDPEPDDYPTYFGVVPAAMPLVDGLPLWATDELFEVEGTWGPGTIGIVDGRLVGGLG